MNWVTSPEIAALIVTELTGCSDLTFSVCFSRLQQATPAVEQGTRQSSSGSDELQALLTAAGDGAVYSFLHYLLDDRHPPGRHTSVQYVTGTQFREPRYQFWRNAEQHDEEWLRYCSACTVAHETHVPKYTRP